MKRNILGIIIFGVALLLIFVYIGELMTRVSGLGTTGRAIIGISPEAGESIFWGKGKCYTCHSVGGRGSAIRAPNLGETGPLNLPIGLRAEERAKEREKQGKAMTATDYLVESIADPGAYVVQGYKNEMPKPYLPPISLKPDEIKAVIAYLQSLGGTVDVAAIKLPPAILAAAAAAPTAEEWKPYTKGDPEVGKALFFDTESPAGCSKCHMVNGRGGDVGPELTNLAGTRTPLFIVESILDPSKEIASGYEATLIITKGGRYITGIVKREDDASIEITDQEGKRLKINKKDIEQRAPQKTSIMPGNFKEVLTIDDFDNILAFLMTLK